MDRDYLFEVNLKPFSPGGLAAKHAGNEPTPWVSAIKGQVAQ